MPTSEKIEAIKGKRLVAGHKFLDALRGLGLQPELMRDLTIHAEVGKPVTITWNGYMTGDQAAQLLEGCEIVEDEDSARV